MFEHKSKAVISPRAFTTRVLSWAGVTLLFMAASLIVGVLGYHYFESLPWIDAILNASMILGGMGEVDALRTDAGKIFASLYALYSGLFLIVCGGLLLTPVFHRVLHKFHAEK